MSNWMQVVALEEVPMLGSRVVDAGELEVALFRTAGDMIFAIKNACPHKGGPLSEGIVHGTSVTCPLHNWKIDLASGEALSPDQGCANTFPVKIENGQIYIELAH